MGAASALCKDMESRGYERKQAREELVRKFGEQLKPARIGNILRAHYGPLRLNGPRSAPSGHSRDRLLGPGFSPSVTSIIEFAISERSHDLSPAPTVAQAVMTEEAPSRKDARPAAPSAMRRYAAPSQRSERPRSRSPPAPPRKTVSFSTEALKKPAKPHNYNGVVARLKEIDHSRTSMPRASMPPAWQQAEEGWAAGGGKAEGRGATCSIRGQGECGDCL